MISGGMEVVAEYFQSIEINGKAGTIFLSVTFYNNTHIKY